MKKTVRKPLIKQVRRKKRNNALGSIFLLIMLTVSALLIFSFFGSRQESTPSIDKEQKTLLNKLIIQDESEDGPAIVIGNIVDDDRVMKMASTDYSKLKSIIGVTSEFVIHFEDEKGNLVNIADRPCIGSSYARVNGLECNP